MARLVLIGGFFALCSVVAGCGDSGDSNPTSSSATGGGDQGGANAGGMGAGGDEMSGGLGGGLEPPIPENIYVDPTVGLDHNEGTFEAPYKTIGQALKKWKPGRDILLMAGAYSAASGETWNYEIPQGATLKGNSEGVVLLGTPGKTAFISTANNGLGYVTLRGFDVAVRAESGSIWLPGVVLDSNAVAVDITGTASVKISEYATITGSTQGIVVSDDATLTLDSVYVDATSKRVVQATENSTVNINNVEMTDSPSADFVVVSGAATLTMSDVSIQGSDHDWVISIATTGDVTMNNVFISDTIYQPIKIDSGTVNISELKLHNCEEGLQITGGTVTLLSPELIDIPDSGVSVYGGKVLIDGGFFANPSWNLQGYAIGVTNGGQLKVRNTQVYNASRAVYADGLPKPDLGTPEDPGGNTFRFNQIGYEAEGYIGKTPAHGNTWEPNIQGSDSQGHYGPQNFFGPTGGPNFKLGSLDYVAL